VDNETANLAPIWIPTAPTSPWQPRQGRFLKIPEMMVNRVDFFIDGHLMDNKGEFIINILF